MAPRKTNKDTVATRSNINHRHNKTNMFKAAIRSRTICNRSYKPLKYYFNRITLSTVFEQAEITGFENNKQEPQFDHEQKLLSSSTDVCMDIPPENRCLENLMKDLTVKTTMKQLTEVKNVQQAEEQEQQHKNMQNEQSPNAYSKPSLNCMRI